REPRARARVLEDPDRAPLAARLSLDDEAPVLESDLARLAVEHQRGEALAFLDDLLHRVPHDDARHAQPPAAVRAAADLHDIRVARDDAHAVDGHPEPFVHELGEARLVALPIGDDADDEVHPAVGMHGYLAAFAWHAGRGVHVVGEADAAA